MPEGRGGGTNALVDGFNKVDVGLAMDLGYAALREAISAEAQRLATIKEAAQSRSQVGCGPGSCPQWAGAPAAQGSSGAHAAVAPAHCGQGLQQLQASQACRPQRPALQENAGPDGGVPVPPARKVVPRLRPGPEGWSLYSGCICRW